MELIGTDRFGVSKTASLLYSFNTVLELKTPDSRSACHSH
jgi:hypothetical protein